jgi:hypothetical protein
MTLLSYKPMHLTSGIAPSVAQPSPVNGSVRRTEEMPPWSY